MTPRKATPRTRDAMTKHMIAAGLRRKPGKARTPFDGTIWQFLTAINEIPIKVKLAQSADDADYRR